MALSKMLQTKLSDISYCLKKTGYFERQLKALHDHFNDIYSEAEWYFSEAEVKERGVSKKDSTWETKNCHTIALLPKLLVLSQVS
jgi:hypothetical protein